MFLAAVSTVPEEPWKFAGVNIPLAGSLESTLKEMEGTRSFDLWKKLIWVNSKPKLRACVPRCQLRVSLACQIGLLRREPLVTVLTPEIPAAVIPRLKPA